MTAPTEQERAEFEKWWSSPHIWGRGHKEAQWASWQAARRAPAAPVISEATVLAITTAYEQGVGKGHQSHTRKEAITNPYSDEWGCDSAWQMGYDEGREQAERKAAAHQPPDAFQTEGGCPVSNAETVAIAALEKVLRAIQRHLPPERIGERETIAEIISIVDPWPLGNLPAPWKDHRTAALVNELRDCAAKYGQTQQLRERIAYIVAPLCAQLKAAEQAAVNQQLTTEAAPVQLPENLREGAPYDNPAFEALARALGVWGTAQSAVCAQFWIAAKEQST